MIGIEELSARVAEAEQRFGLISEEHAKYSARLVSLLDTVETRLQEQEAEVKRQADATAALRDERDEARGENEQLRDMLLSLLRAVENGGRDHVMQTMQTLETRVSGLVEASPSDHEAVAPCDGAEMPAPPAADCDGPDGDPPNETEPVEIAPETEEVALDEADVLHDMTRPGQDEASEAALEPGEPAVSLAEIMQRVSDLAGADDDPEAADPAEPRVAGEELAAESLADESADDPAEVRDPSVGAAATGS